LDQPARESRPQRSGFDTAIVTGFFLSQGFFTLRYAAVAAFPGINLAGKIVAILGLFVLGGIARAEFLKHAGARGEGTWPLPKDLVDTGPYSIVRHPMALGMMISSVGLMMIGQHWTTYLVGAGLIAFLYTGARQEERLNREKFGNAYDDYTKRVPRINAILGLIRLAGQSAGKDG